MLETLMKLYVMAMANDTRTPTPHLFGPPGCGKSTSVEQLAELLGVNLHIINVSRLSPLEVEGLQMPVEENTRLHFLTATFWTRIKEGDIVLFDEFLRGFPEVYNALLDIFTSRQVGGFTIPKAFFVAASNSTIAYDKALEDRLLHIPVKDPRRVKSAKALLAHLLVDQLGLLPEMETSTEMQSLLDTEVLPMFDILDNLKNKQSSSPGSLKGKSIRNLIGQAQMRQVESAALDELIKINNVKAIQAAKWQYVFLVNGKNVDPTYQQRALQLQGNPKLTELQARNLELNLQLIELEESRTQKEGTTDDDDIFTEPPF